MAIQQLTDRYNHDAASAQQGIIIPKMHTQATDDLDATMSESTAETLRGFPLNQQEKRFWYGQAAIQQQLASILPPDAVPSQEEISVCLPRLEAHTGVLPKTFAKTCQHFLAPYGYTATLRQNLTINDLQHAIDEGHAVSVLMMVPSYNNPHRDESAKNAKLGKRGVHFENVIGYGYGDDEASMESMTGSEKSRLTAASSVDNIKRTQPQPDWIWLANPFGYAERLPTAEFLRRRKLPRSLLNPSDKIAKFVLPTMNGNTGVFISKK